MALRYGSKIASKSSVHLNREPYIDFRYYSLHWFYNIVNIIV